MNFSERFESIFKRVLPSPFTIAVVLTLFSVLIAIVFTDSPKGQNHFINVMGYWEKGMWDSGLLAFAIQMMLMLVLGHTLALSPFVSQVINRIIIYGSSPAKAAWLVTFFTLLLAFFNWGLGLIFGAIIARKVGEKFSKEGKKLNYALIGAAGYSGLMVWHGGISGSAPAKAAEFGNLKSMMSGIIPENELATLPNKIGFNETVFSPMNLSLFFVLLLLLPFLMAWLARRTSSKVISIKHQEKNIHIPEKLLVGAEKLDHSRILCLSFACLILAYSLYIPLSLENFNWGFINPNYINLLLMGLALLFHSNFSNFLKAIDKAIGGASGILIQFPLYFGIMGIMKYSGLIGEISDFFSSVSNEQTLPLFTFLSAGIVNVFVPSGGGQWAIQGPILIQAAESLQVPLAKNIMAMSYGDQITNMLQPFWALPLLGITGLKAREIIPYTLILMLSGIVLFLLALILF